MWCLFIARRCATLLRWVPRGAGLWALHHVAVTAPVEDLRWQRALLLDTAQGAISGADERCWPAAATAAVALVCAVEGSCTCSTRQKFIAIDFVAIFCSALGACVLEARKAAAASGWTLGMCPAHHHTCQTMAWSELDTLIAVILSL